MQPRTKLIILGGISIVLILFYLFYQLGTNWGYILPRRGYKVLAIALTGAAIAFSTVIFQTITNNRILTPSIMGLDSVYLFIQTVLIYFFGSTSVASLKNLNFILSVGLMVLFAALIYRLLFMREQQNIYFLLLVGIIFGTLFDSLATFMQVLIDPNEFMAIQDKMFASFNNVNTDLLYISMITFGCISLYFRPFNKYLDVISLGREQAINLGVDYEHIVKRMLFIIAILVSVATVLVGPITFLGLLVANIAYEFLRTYKHSMLITGAILISIIALVGGQLIVERVFTFSTTLSVIINFVGGVYFIYLLLRGSRAW